MSSYFSNTWCCISMRILNDRTLNQCIFCHLDFETQKISLQQRMTPLYTAETCTLSTGNRVRQPLGTFSTLCRALGYAFPTLEPSVGPFRWYFLSVSRKSARNTKWHLKILPRLVVYLSEITPGRVLSLFQHLLARSSTSFKAQSAQQGDFLVCEWRSSEKREARRNRWSLYWPRGLFFGWNS